MLTSVTLVNQVSHFKVLPVTNKGSPVCSETGPVTSDILIYSGVKSAVQLDKTLVVLCSKCVIYCHNTIVLV